MMEQEENLFGTGYGDKKLELVLTENEGEPTLFIGTREDTLKGDFKIHATEEISVEARNAILSLNKIWADIVSGD